MAEGDLTTGTIGARSITNIKNKVDQINLGEVTDKVYINSVPNRDTHIIIFGVEREPAP